MPSITETNNDTWSLSRSSQNSPSHLHSEESPKAKNESPVTSQFTNADGDVTQKEVSYQNPSKESMSLLKRILNAIGALFSCWPIGRNRAQEDKESSIPEIAQINDVPEDVQEIVQSSKENGLQSTLDSTTNVKELHPTSGSTTNVKKLYSTSDSTTNAKELHSTSDSTTNAKELHSTSDSITKTTGSIYEPKTEKEFKQFTKQLNEANTYVESIFKRLNYTSYSKFDVKHLSPIRALREILTSYSKLDVNLLNSKRTLHEINNLIVKIDDDTDNLIEGIYNLRNFSLFSDKTYVAVVQNVGVSPRQKELDEMKYYKIKRMYRYFMSDKVKFYKKDKSLKDTLLIEKAIKFAYEHIDEKIDTKVPKGAPENYEKLVKRVAEMRNLFVSAHDELIRIRDIQAKLRKQQDKAFAKKAEALMNYYPHNLPKTE